MIKKFYIVSCAALVACLCLFSQDAGATAQQSEAAARTLSADAGATIRLAQRVFQDRTAFFGRFGRTQTKLRGEQKKLKKKGKKGKKGKTPSSRDLISRGQMAPFSWR